MPATKRLITRGPFHLQATVRVLQRRPTNRVDVWDGSRYLRVLPVECGHILAAITNNGTVVEPDLRVTLLAGDPPAALRTDLEDVGKRLGAILGLNVDPAPLQRAALSDPALRQVASDLTGMRPPRFAGLFESFLNVIPFQQLSLDAGIAIIGRLVEHFGHALEYRGVSYYAPPDSAAIAAARPATLRGCGLSARKVDTLQAVAKEVTAGALCARQVTDTPTSEMLRDLVQLPGIGPWSAALVLLRGFRCLDVFPPGDVGAQRTLGKLLTLDSDEVYERVQEFGEFKGYVYFLGLGASLLRKGLIESAGPSRSR